MEWILWAACAVLFIAVLVLAVRVYLLRRSAREIAAGLSARISTNTNTLIGISSRDRAMRALAESVNTELRALRRERRRLQQGDRELREAVTNISHDLRTPLTAICGYLELLEREEKSAAAARYLGQIENRTAALTRLTEELFRYSLVLADEAVELQPVVLNRVLEESLLAQYGAFRARGLAPAVQMPLSIASQPRNTNVPYRSISVYPAMMKPSTATNMEAFFWKTPVSTACFAAFSEPITLAL